MKRPWICSSCDHLQMKVQHFSKILLLLFSKISKAIDSGKMFQTGSPQRKRIPVWEKKGLTTQLSIRDLKNIGKGVKTAQKKNWQWLTKNFSSDPNLNHILGKARIQHFRWFKPKGRILSYVAIQQNIIVLRS